MYIVYGFYRNVDDAPLILPLILVLVNKQRKNPDWYLELQQDELY